MVRHPRIQFVIADGSRARWVVRSDKADDFVTVMERKAPAPERGGPQGVVFEGSSGQRFSVEQRDAAAHHRRLRFAEELADAINEQAANAGFDRLVVVAPSRLLIAISQRLSSAARARLAGSLTKDLTKTPDHELGAWLRRLEFS